MRWPVSAKGMWDSGRRKAIPDALSAFQAQHAENADETKRRYKRTLRYFSEFCKSDSLTYTDQIDVEAMDRFAPSRNQMKSWRKDVELLRQFLEFCRDRDWTSKNPARSLKIPKLDETDEVVPYT